MSTLYGLNYNKVYNENGKVRAGEFNGHVKTLYDEITFEDDVIALNSTIDLGKLPKGARVLSAVMKGASTGTTGKFELGYTANGVDAADPDAFIPTGVNLDTGGQAAQVSGNGDGIGKKFEAETKVQAKVTEATDNAEDVKIQCWIHYIVD